jgi:peroxidase
MRARRYRSARRRRSIAVVFGALLLAAGTLFAASPWASAGLGFEVQSLDGTGNNVNHPEWGKAGTNYPRLLPARYADGHSAVVDGPNARYISNRVFSDLGQNIFSEHRNTQWAWTWAQFLDHTFGLVQGGTEAANIPFDSKDPLERFTDNLGVVPFTRSAPAPGTGMTNARQQVNTVNSYIDAWPVYGGTDQRLEWLREGSVDGNLGNNGPRLRLPGGYLPTRDSRGDPATAPDMAVDGRLAAHPERARVAGDVRANENIALTATHTLFAREHNRIVSTLPTSLSAEQKFQIARRIVIAEQQYITYHEFLPAMGVSLPAYTGYRPNVDSSITDEFATVGYRGHSQIHGEIEIETDADRYSAAQLAQFTKEGVGIEKDGADITLTISLNLALFNPDLLPQVQLGPMLKAIGAESEYNNDEMIDDTLRSVLFQIPVSGNPECLEDPSLPDCFNGVADLGAMDIQRGRDHGMPGYNALRKAYGLPPARSFKDITGESSESFPPGTGVNDPKSLDFVKLTDIDGKRVKLPDTVNNTATHAVRRTPLAARLKAVYGSVDKVDAFVGMVAEAHLPGTEFGPLQLAVWQKQFRALRDGDRFFYGNDPGLSLIKKKYGIDFRHSLADLIAANTDIRRSELSDDVFLTADDDLPAAKCSVTYQMDNLGGHDFRARLRIENKGDRSIDGWTLRFAFANGQSVRQARNAAVFQRGVNVALRSHERIPKGGKVTDVSFTGRWDDTTNAEPVNFSLNGARCARE